MKPLVYLMSLFILGSCLTSGCGKRVEGEPTYPVSGKVFFKGEPVAAGEITFHPENPALSPDVGEIHDGAFQFAAKAGPVRVEIFASRPTGKMIDPPPGEVGESYPEVKNYIPAEYNTQSKLTETVTEDKSKNQFEFDLNE